MDQESLRQEINGLRWFHQIDFGNDLLTPGVTPIEQLRAQADIYFLPRLDGISVLDVGCWDGFNSFEAKRRGAARVLATDYTTWNLFWGNRRCFELARAHIAPDVEMLEIDVPDLSPTTVGSFDVVLFAGVLYHLKNPFAALELLRPLVKQTLIVETHMDALNIAEPAAIFYTHGYGNDESNWWGPNRPCIEGMLHRAGFGETKFTAHPTIPGRGIFHTKPV